MSDPDWKQKNKEEADKLRKEADRLEKSADQKVSEAQRDEFYGDGALGKMIPGMNSEKADRTNDMRAEAEGDRARAKRLRESADDIENAPIESVLGDIGRDSYKPQIESVLSDIGKESYESPTGFGFDFIFSYKVIIPILIGFSVVGYLMFWSDDRETVWVAGPDGVMVEMDMDEYGNSQRIQVPLNIEGTIQSDGSVDVASKKYYVVTSTDKAKDTGNEVCAAAGKKCVGYTDFTLASCLAHHPGAQTSSDMDGSKAGFYCNGAPQGGVCAKEVNTCHICPKCQVNMDCAMEIGVLYRETYVECE